MNREARDFWRAKRREIARHNRGPILPESSPTVLLLVLLVLFYLVETFAPGLLGALAASPAGPWVLLVLSAIDPGSLLGLLFLGLFVYVLGRELEGLDETWKLLLAYFLSGAMSAFLVTRVSGVPLVPSFAAFGLAGVYASWLLRGRLVGQRGAYTWVAGLLVLNAFLMGFQPVELLGMVSALAVGFFLAHTLPYGRSF